MKIHRGHYLISAGEYSGDLLAADFVKEFRRVDPELQPFGIVGDNMRRADVIEVASMDQFAVMGIWDVAKKLGDIRRVLSHILAKVDVYQPKLAVLVDFPGLHFELASQLRLRGIPVFQYVAPKVWAWGGKRVEALRRDFRMVLGVLPFEEKFFREHDVNYNYVGSPHLDRVAKIIVDRSSMGFVSDDKIVALLPGSRPAELSLIFPRLLQIKERLCSAHPHLKFVMPLANSLTKEDLIKILPRPEALKTVSDIELEYQGIRIFKGMSLELMSVADCAIVASGTATLECALLGTPMAVVYVTSEATYEIARSMIKVPHVSLVNLICGYEVVPEYIQDFRAEDVAQKVWNLLSDPNEIARMHSEFKRIRDSMSGGAGAVAARTVFESYIASSPA